jgi:uncharacterized protein YfdQ (DUF2303 family)
MESENPRSPALLAALVAAEQLSRPIVIEGIPHAIVPEGYSLENLERVRAEPKRTRGNFAVVTGDAFNRTVCLLRKGAGRPLPIFFGRSGTEATVTAVLNFDDWRDLTVTLAQKLSDPFREWYGKNGAAQAQRAFALFLEERTAHVVKPDGAALLELARKFKANVSVRYQSVIEQENGDNSLEFIQTTEAGSAGAKSRMKVPNFITLLMPVWHGGEPVKFEARFGYSISDDGKLALSFEILNLSELLSTELRKIVEKIGREHAASVIIEGANSSVPSL